MGIVYRAGDERDGKTVALKVIRETEVSGEESAPHVAEARVRFTREAEILKGKKILELPPASAATDENGKAVFTVTGNKKTEEELPEIKFTAGDLKAKIAVRVQTTVCVPESMQTEPEEKLMLELGKSGNVTVKVRCERGNPAVDAKVEAVIHVRANTVSTATAMRPVTRPPRVARNRRTQRVRKEALCRGDQRWRSSTRSGGAQQGSAR